MTETERRLFTPEEANATLPLVRRIVADLQALHPRWRAAVTTYEAAQADADATEEADVARAARLDAGRLAGEIESCLDELEQIGCEFKGFDAGLVDFPAMLDEREVRLCWCAGEERVAHWHEADAGFDDRRPLEAVLPGTGAR